jgi:hypothetical protein
MCLALHALRLRLQSAAAKNAAADDSDCSSDDD